jgi:hypothetical protein
MFSFLYHFQRLLSELTVYMSNTVGVLSEAGTAYPSRALELSPVFFVKSVLLFFVVFLRWSIMCFNVLSSVLWCPLRTLLFEIWIFRNGQPNCDDDRRIFVAMTSANVKVKVRSRHLSISSIINLYQKININRMRSFKCSNVQFFNWQHICPVWWTSATTSDCYHNG